MMHDAVEPLLSGQGWRKMGGGQAQKELVS